MVPRATKNAVAATKDPVAPPVEIAEVPPSYDVVARPEGVAAIYASLNRVHHKLCDLGIGKDQRNQHQGFNFRGIDDVYNVISGMLADENVITPPQFSDRVVTERKTKKGDDMFNVAVRGTYRFTSTIDGSFVEATTFGEASDSGDKATAKAMAVAHKYAHFQLFNIPIEGRPEDRDPDFNSEEVGDRSRPQAAANRAPARAQKVEEPAAPEDEDQSPTEDTIAGGVVEAHLRRVIPNVLAQEKARNKLLDAYGVMLLDDIAENLHAEAISKIDTYVKAQAERAKAKTK